MVNLIVLDFETYFDNDYSLNKMTTEAYVRDSRFEAHGLGVRYHNGNYQWFDDPEYFLHRMRDDPNVAVLCHHAHFDGLILSHHYGIKPGRWLDTLSMARYLFGPRQDKSLEGLAARFGFASKTVPYGTMKGRHWRDFSSREREEIVSACLHDCELTWQVWCELMKEFPPGELPIIDLTVRMFTEPTLQGDQALLREIYQAEILEKNQRLYELGVSEKDLASAVKFSEILQAEGIEVGMKAGKNGPIPALAKSDTFMQTLLESDDERISALAEARVAVKSTIDETRSARLLAMAQRGPLAVYLNFCGAHTRRWSGGDALNFQNLRRKSKLRRSICAPTGYLIAAPDQSQGECRILEWFAGEEQALQDFRDGADPYIGIASKFYGRPITRADEAERGTGKQIRLSCGYGAGGETIVRTAAKGAYGPPVKLTQAQGLQARDLYRFERPKVVKLWQSAQYDLLPALARGNSDYWAPDGTPLLWVENKRLYHPNGTWLDYSGLKYVDGEWRLFDGRGGWTKMYGGKMVENIIQWLSRIVTTEAMVRIAAAGYRIVGMAHDDVWVLIPDDTEVETLIHVDWVKQQMARTPEWAPGLPLAADCKVGKTYS